MKLWLIKQGVANGYDTYSDAVVAADTEAQARATHPRGRLDTYERFILVRDGSFVTKDPYDHDEPGEAPRCWCAKVADVTATYLGEAKEGTEAGVICASYHAG